LIEAVVVAETWFFRNREAFVALAREVAGEWLRAHPEGMFRLLSVPCATGEEPYSMAMARLEGGFVPSQLSHRGPSTYSVAVRSGARVGAPARPGQLTGEASFQWRQS
jgi:chemotaxis protein methyltransferase WspC